MYSSVQLIFYYFFKHIFLFIFRIALAIPPAITSGISEESITPYSRCSVYAVNFTELLEQGITTADPLWPIEKCQHGWEFNYTEIPYPSIAAEVNYEKS